MIVTQEQHQPSSFTPFIRSDLKERLNSQIKTDTLVPLEYLNAISYRDNVENDVGYDCVFEFENFDYKFDLQITDVEWSLESDEIYLYLTLDNLLFIKATLLGRWEGDNEKIFKLQQFNLNLERKLETPLSEFLTSTLWAMLGLSKDFRVRIPLINYDFRAGFTLPINEIKKLLQERQIAQRLIFIEAALGIFLPFPQGYIEGKDIENIAFCYHAIVDREFDWFNFGAIIPWIANEESLSWLPSSKQPFSTIFQPEVLTKEIFGVEIVLGLLTAKIENAVIDNYDEVKEKLSKLDNEIVEVKMRTLNGKSRILAIDVPIIIPEVFTLKLIKLFLLEKDLDELLLDRYFNLASSTLEGLTEEQIKIVTKRPKMGKTPRISM